MLILRKLFFFAFLLLSSRGFCGEFLEEIKSAYGQLFPSSPVVKVKPSYGYDYKSKFSQNVLDKFNYSPSTDLFPQGIFYPSALGDTTTSFFGIKNIISYASCDQPEKYKNFVDKTYLDAHLEFIKTYWLGYIAFLEELNGKEGNWDAFTRRFESQLNIPDINDPWIKVYYSEERVQNSNKHELLPVFLVHYSLGTFFHESNKISVAMRIKALMLWGKIDPQLDFFKQKSSYRYGKTVLYQKKWKNLLPLSFDENLLEGQKITNWDFSSNITIASIFVNPRTQQSFHKGLQILFADYKQEMIQVMHSILQMESSQPSDAGPMTLRFLLSITQSDDNELLGIILGEHASYRNKGRVTRIIDELPLLSKETLIETVRHQKVQLKEKELLVGLAQKSLADEREQAKETLDRVVKSSSEHTKKLKKSLISYQATLLLASYDPEADYAGLFRLFRVNTLLGFKENQDTIKWIFKIEAPKFHTDKHTNATDEEKQDLNTQMASLIEGRDMLTNEITYQQYYNECAQRAYTKAYYELVNQ